MLHHPSCHPPHLVIVCPYVQSVHTYMYVLAQIWACAYRFSSWLTCWWVWAVPTLFVAITNDIISHEWSSTVRRFPWSTSMCIAYMYMCIATSHACIDVGAPVVSYYPRPFRHSWIPFSLPSMRLKSMPCHAIRLLSKKQYIFSCTYTNCLANWDTPLLEFLWYCRL